MAEQQTAPQQQEPEVPAAEVVAPTESPTQTTENGVHDPALAAYTSGIAPVEGVPMTTTTIDGRTVQVRPCKYFPNCAKMDDPEHNAMYSHTAVVKRPPPRVVDPSKPPRLGIPNPNAQLCGFGEQCKRCGDEEHLEKYIHSCKFGPRCKKIDDPIHLKRFIHVLPGSMPPVPPPFPPGRGPRHAAPYPFSSFHGYPPPPYPYPYMPPPGAAAGGSTYPPPYPSSAPYSPPSASHHSRAAPSYHPYGGGAGGYPRAGAADAGSAYARPSAADAGYARPSAADAERAAAYAGYGYGAGADARAPYGKDEWAQAGAAAAGYPQGYGGDARAPPDYSAYANYGYGLPTDGQYAL